MIILNNFKCKNIIYSALFIVNFIFCLTFFNNYSTAQSANPKLIQKGKACHYADKFKGRRTSSGEKYHPNKLTAAHKTLPLGTKVLVKNLENNKSVVVTINDRGPFTKRYVIDLSKAAAKKLGIFKNSNNRIGVYTYDANEVQEFNQQIANERVPSPALVPEPEDDLVQSIWFSKIMLDKRMN